MNRGSYVFTHLDRNLTFSLKQRKKKRQYETPSFFLFVIKKNMINQSINQSTSLGQALKKLYQGMRSSLLAPVSTWNEMGQPIVWVACRKQHTHNHTHSLGAPQCTAQTWTTFSHSLIHQILFSMSLPTLECWIFCLTIKHVHYSKLCRLSLSKKKSFQTK